MPSALELSVLPMGDRAFLIKLKPINQLSGDPVSPTDQKYQILRAARYLARFLEQIPNKPEGLSQTEFVAGYASVLVPFEPELTENHSLKVWLEAQILVYAELYTQPEFFETWGVESAGRLHRIPVRYGGEYGPDLDTVARLNNLTPARVIELHAGQTYEVYLVGFAPGFAYLGPLPVGLDAPRLERPRPKVKAGSVAIAAGLTGVYPLDSPGGWRLIGSTTVSIFNPDQDPPVLFRPGDKINFYPI